MTFLFRSRQRGIFATGPGLFIGQMVGLFPNFLHVGPFIFQSFGGRFHFLRQPLNLIVDEYEMLTQLGIELLQVQMNRRCLLTVIEGRDLLSQIFMSFEILRYSILQ